ncbi:MAG: hypothetical protein V2A65_05020 [Candidatus Omnitrophota bacterium]
MAEIRETPEKRLLTLIESPKRIITEQVRASSKRIFSHVSFRKGPGLSQKRKTFTDIRDITRILALITGGVLIYFVHTVLSPSRNLEGVYTAEPPVIKETEKDEIGGSPAIKVGGTEEDTGALLKEPPDLTEKFGHRNIFDFGKQESEKKKEPEKVVISILKQPEEEINTPPPKREPTPQEELEELAGNLKLVGVSWSSDPDVMIENTKTNKTYFLKKGDGIEGGIKIEQVLRDKIILGYKGTTAKLQLQ